MWKSSRSQKVYSCPKIQYFFTRKLYSNIHFFSPTRIPTFIDWTSSIFSFLGSESNVGVERNRERPVDTCGNHETSGQLGVVKQ